MKIKLKHIKQAERFLLNGGEFDVERKEFITNFETRDLLAVPGSGKTTALLAKLYCIDKQLPLENNRGILVLSHTNKAVEEIERMLKPVCPNLFNYPNFVGTIQSFVNRFISNQAWFEEHGSYIRKNEDDIAWQEILWKVKNSTCGYYLKRNARPGEDLIDVIKSVKYLDDKFLVKGRTLGFKTKSGKVLKKIYDDLHNSGVIFYDDSYKIANKYLEKHPKIKDILKGRFKYIFIDEMQDLDGQQVNLLEKVFFEPGDSDNIIQRIGDKNQAIFSSSSSVSNDSFWVTRKEMDSETYKDLSLQNSHRLSPKIAKLVDGFVLNRPAGYEVKSSSEYKGDDLPPHLVVYEDEYDGQKLKNKFCELIKKFKLTENPQNIKNGFHIVAWTTEKENDPDKWHLKKIFSEFSKEMNRKLEDFDSLAKYLFNYDRDEKTFAAIRKSILNGIIRVLRITDVKDSQTQKPYRKSGFIRQIKGQGESHHSSFKKRLYEWCYEIIVEENYAQVFKDYVTFINEDLSEIIPDFKPEQVEDFVSKKTPPWMDNSETNNQTVEELKEEIPIKLSSVHSIKGQTHCATMYVGTEYYDYETKKLSNNYVLSNPLYYQEQNRKTNSVRFYETLKMMYVGFSRPTDLLCFAVRRQNVEKDIDKFKESGWCVIDITKEKNQLRRTT